MTPLDDTDIEILTCGADGVCIRYVWHWLLRGEPVGRSVRKLKKRGLIDFMYFSGGKASSFATEAGKAARKSVT